MLELEAEKDNYDIIAVTETWLGPEIGNDKIRLDGFGEVERLDREGDNHGGVAIYIRSNLSVKRRDDLTLRGLEGLWVEINCDNTSLLVGVMYRPPNSKVEMWSKIEEALEQAKMAGPKHIFLMGDMNCDMNKKGNRLEEILDTMHMTQLITDITHRTDHSETTLDIIATNSLDMVKTVHTGSPTLSNHSDVSVSIDLRKQKTTGPRRRVFNYRRADWVGMNAEIENTDWEEILTRGSMDDIVEAWTTKFSEIIKQYIPQRTVKQNEENNPWLTPEIKTLRKRKQRAYKKATHSNKERDWRKFNRLRNRLKNKIRKSKEDHDEKLAEKIKDAEGSEEKLWWSLVGEFYQKTRNSRAESPPLNIDGEIVGDDKEKAEKFNEYFISMTRLNEETAQKLPEIPDMEEALSNIQITYSTVKEILENLKEGKASGPDEISARVLKHTAETISRPLCRIFNFSIASGNFPNKWKIANVVPIHKKNARDIMGNYRPVSLLPIAGKCMERCVQKVVLNYLIENGRLSNLQGA
jgi:hypothetical protein